MIFLPRAPTWRRTFVELVSRARARDWAYAIPTSRDLRIDLLRGIAVFVMVVNHFGGASWLFLVTGGDTFFVSAAEAFIFISGLTVGMVYGAIALSEGLRAAQIKALVRAWTLYKVTIVLTLALALIAFTFGLPWVNGRQVDNPLFFSIEVLLLRQTMYLSDVMMLYTFLLLATPLALWLLIKRRAGLLLIASSALWLAFQIGRVQIPWNIVGNGTFNLAAWQLLFFVAMVLGFHRRAVQRALLHLPRGATLILFAILLALLMKLHRSIGVEAELQWLFAKSALAPGRLFASCIVFSFAYLAVTLFWKPIAGAFGWLLLPFGQNALYAYTIHVAIIALWYLALIGLPADVRGIAEINTGVQLLAVLLIWGMIRRQFLFRIVPR
jgi:hypothetical protein